MTDRIRQPSAPIANCHSIGDAASPVRTNPITAAGASRKADANVTSNFVCSMYVLHASFFPSLILVCSSLRQVVFDQVRKTVESYRILPRKHGLQKRPNGDSLRLLQP